MSNAWLPHSRLQLREMLMVVGPALLVVVAGFWLAYQFVEPAPPKRLVITTGSEQGAYFGFAKKYAESLKKNGITLDVVQSKGSVENIARMTGGEHRFDLALLQGGIANQNSASGLMSYGRIFLEPLWIFHTLPGDVDRLTAFDGKRIAIGPVGSGTRVLVETLLVANGLKEGRTTLLPLGSGEAVAALERGEADAAFFSLAPESPLIQKLVRDPRFKMASLAQAEAYTRTFSYLTRIVLPEGGIDLARNIPPRDVVLVAAQAALIARDDLHPGLAWPLVDALRSVHRGGGLFHRIGEFPVGVDPEFEMSEDAQRIYVSGAPFFQRFLPFWLASFIERMLIMVVPIATILVPLVKLGPMLYDWRIKRRLLHWYGQLKTLERSISATAMGQPVSPELKAEVDRIDDAVAMIPVPLHYSDRLYELRGAIDLVRQRLHARV